jgi:hypothetical protein
MEQPELKKPVNTCVLCGNASGIRKRSFFLYGGNLHLRVCLPCILSAGSGSLVMQRLEKLFPKLADGREKRFKKNGGGQL